MNGTFYIGATGLEAQQRALDATANNIVNINTPGFKRTSVRFSELVAAPNSAVDEMRADTTPIATLAGVRVDSSGLVWSQGDLKATGSAMDIAIDGAGFVEVLGNEGQIRLWRGGSLRVNEDGFLATGDGVPLKAMISVPTSATELKIDSAGIVTAQTSPDGPVERLGQIELTLVDGLDQLSNAGGGYFDNDAAAPTTNVVPGSEGGGRIVQGAIEGSNVDLSEQMINLMVLQRSYAANAQLVQAGDQVMALLNNLRK